MNKDKLKEILSNLYDLSKQAYLNKEVPISACLYYNDETYYSTNEVERYNNPFKHAEINVLNKALAINKTRYLKDSILIVTLEPCLMCLGSLIKAGVKELYYVSDDIKDGALSHYHAFIDDKLKVTRIEDKKFDELLKEFFQELRNDKTRSL